LLAARVRADMGCNSSRQEAAVVDTAPQKLDGSLQEDNGSREDTDSTVCSAGAGGSPRGDHDGPSRRASDDARAALLEEGDRVEEPARAEDGRGEEPERPVGREPETAPTPLSNDAIIVIDGCCCGYCGLLCGGDCVGCMASETLCCLEMECCCKSGQEKLCCICCAASCVSPTVCIKSQGHMCCLAGAATFPWDDEVPCLFGTCGIICYPGIFICKTLGEIKGEGGSSMGPAWVG